MILKWTSEQDRQSIYQSAISDYEKAMLDLAEHLGDHYWPQSSWGFDFSEYTLDQIGNALVLVVSHNENGEDFYNNLTPIEKALFGFFTELIVQQSTKYAASQSHKGEGDETLADSE